MDKAKCHHGKEKKREVSEKPIKEDVQRPLRPMKRAL
jgi:hypothetical protein